MGKSSIEWTGETWNPVRGCIKVSPGCKHCYAETFAERWRGIPGHAYEQGFDPLLVPHKLSEPLSWRKPTTVFVNSMSDLFGEFVPSEYIAAVHGVMAATPQHTYQILTKRAERLPAWFDWMLEQDEDTDPDDGTPGRLEACWQALAHEVAHHPLGDGGPLHTKYSAEPLGPWPLPNVWYGVSVENRKHGVPRIDHIRRAPAAVRFLSIEPLLEDVGDLDLTGIHWVIAGAESGRKARPMEDNWVRRVRDQCTEQGVKFFFKQRVVGGKKVSLPMLDGRTWEEMPARATP